MKCSVFLMVVFIFIMASCLNTNHTGIQIWPKDSVSVFKKIKLSKDSLNLSLRISEKIQIPTNSDSLEIELISINKFCFLGEVSCDVPSTVQLKVKKDNITYTLPKFDLGWGAGSRIEVYPTPNCKLFNNVDLNIKTFNNTVIFKNLIFTIKEITPYPTSRFEVINMTEKKLFSVNFIIQNKCPE